MDEERGAWAPKLGDGTCAATRPSQNEPQVTKAVEAAIDDAELLFMLGMDSTFEDLDPVLAVPLDSSVAVLDAGVREVYWRDPALGPAVFQRAVQLLGDAGVSCADCRVESPPHRSMNLAELRPYVRAWVWPLEDADPSRTPIYVCSGANGVAELGLTDRLAIDTGHLGAGALAFDEAVSDKISQIAQLGRWVEETHGLIDAVLETPEATAVVCSGVARTSWFTGVVVTDCPDARTKGAAAGSEFEQ